VAVESPSLLSGLERREERERGERLMERPSHGNQAQANTVNVTIANTSIYVFTAVLGPHCLPILDTLQPYIHGITPLVLSPKEVTFWTIKEDNTLVKEEEKIFAKERILEEVPVNVVETILRTLWLR
jgi:hypothetical protein